MKSVCLCLNTIGVPPLTDHPVLLVFKRITTNPKDERLETEFFHPIEKGKPIVQKKLHFWASMLVSKHVENHPKKRLSGVPFRR